MQVKRSYFDLLCLQVFVRVEINCDDPILIENELNEEVGSVQRCWKNTDVDFPLTD